MNLYHANELARLESHIDEDGVIDIESFNNAQIALRDKQLAVVAWIKNNDANIELLDGAIKSLQERKKAMQSRLEELKSYLLVNMKVNNITQINANDMTFSAKIRLNPPSVIIDDELAIPDGFKTLPTPPPLVPNKTMIKDAIKSGIEVPGCRLVQAERVEIK